MQSGITVGDEVREKFQDLRMKRAYRYVIYKASEDKSSVEVEKCGERDETFEQFKEAMPKNKSR
jgi:7-cyano-7-deazaguanine synthase in queuosine biosynthesis